MRNPAFEMKIEHGMNDLPSIFQGTQTYHSYLVRLWQSHEEGRWRASAQCVQTGRTVLFANVESLLAYLQKQAATTDGEVKRKPFSSGPAM